MQTTFAAVFAGLMLAATASEAADTKHTIQYQYWNENGSPSSLAEEPTAGGFFTDFEQTTATDWLTRLGIDAYGLVDVGFTWNPDNPRDRSNGTLLYNDRSNEAQMNALYAVIERVIEPDACEWKLGGRIDTVFGTAGRFLGVPGLELHSDLSPRWNSDSRRFYHFALPQFYLEANVPVGEGISVKAGRFFSPLGFEIASVDDFLLRPYSFGTMESFAEPYTHTGLLAATEVTPGVQITAGITRGLDNFEDNNNDLSFVGRIRISSPDDRTRFTAGVHTGDEDPAGQQNVTVCVFTLTHQLTDRLTYRLQHDVGFADDFAINSGFGTDDAEWYGLSQILACRFSNTVSGLVRFEWYRDDDHATILSLMQGIPHDLIEGGTYYSLTGGLQITLAENVVLRPELRWDWADVSAPLFGIQGPFDNLSDQNQFTAAADLLIAF